MKVRSIVLAAALTSSATAFTVAPATRAFAPTPLFAEEADAAPEESTGGALVPIKEETIEFTAGLIGGAVGFAVGGPILGAITAAAANYASKTDQPGSGFSPGARTCTICTSSGSDGGPTPWPNSNGCPCQRSAC